MIVVQSIQRRCLEGSQDAADRVRQSVRAAENRIAVRIRSLRPLPEEGQSPLGSDGLVKFQRRDFRNPVRVVGLGVVVGQGRGAWPDGKWEQRQDLRGYRIETRYRYLVARELRAIYQAVS